MGLLQPIIGLTESRKEQFAESVCTLVNTLLDLVAVGQLTIVEPTATLMLRVRWSFLETLIAVRHSSLPSEGKSGYNTECPPAMQFIMGNRMSAIHSLLMIPESLSIDSTSDSALMATS
jgi:hypothetical protein